MVLEVFGHFYFVDVIFDYEFHRSKQV